MTTSSFPAVKTTMAKGAVLALALVLAAPLSAVTADAKAGGGSSFGSRGSRTYSAPPSTATAPRTAQPMQRTETPSPGYNNPGYGTAAAAQPGRRFGGFGTGLAAGLLGAGLIGMLTGHGFFGGFAGLASIFGFLFQVALIGGLIWLAIRFFRGRSQPAYAGGPSPAAAGPSPGPYARTALGGLGGLGGGARPGVREAVEIGPSDYAAFERALVEIQDAYGREDLGTLSRLTTPEMIRYFGADLEENRRRNVRNEVTGAKLLQGDLAESWREGDTDYATVAMRFTVLDTMVDRMSGRVISGNASIPSEATELWTFRRDGRGPWLLSAIQQTS
jgi:predicted lipid-binding transport protein (Tim44 family)